MALAQQRSWGTQKKQPKKTEEEVTKELLAELSDGEIMALPRTKLDEYCRAIRVDTKARKQDLQEELKKLARTLRQHARRNRRSPGDSERSKAPQVVFAGQRVPQPHPGSRGCNLPLHSTLAGDVRAAAMEGNVLRLELLLGRLNVEDRAKVANAGGEAELEDDDDEGFDVQLNGGRHSMDVIDALETSRGVSPSPTASSSSSAAASIHQAPTATVAMSKASTTGEASPDRAENEGHGPPSPSASSYRIGHAAGDHALHLACWKGHTPAAAWLLQHCGSAAQMVNLRGRGGLGPLHWAVKGGAEATARWLLAHGADAAARDDRGNTPLDTCLHALHQMDAREAAEVAAAELRGEDAFRPDADQVRRRATLEALTRLLAAAAAGQDVSSADAVVTAAVMPVMTVTSP
jgi:hypothetical protein